MIAGNSPEPITGTRPSAEPLPVPDCMWLENPYTNMLEILEKKTGKTVEELIRIAITELYHRRICNLTSNH